MYSCRREARPATLMKQSLIIMFSTIALMATAAARADWIRPDPSQGPTARHSWGIAGGMSIGLWPLPGPRGLIRIYTPYLNQPENRVMNFIAIEPIVAGERDLSELEPSPFDHKPGKRLWTTDNLDADLSSFTPIPARGVVTKDGNIEQLHVFIHVERFHNGAEPIVEATFRSDRPDEITLKTFASAASAAMQSCMLTATMGNFARLRHLHLKSGTIQAADVFKDRLLDPNSFFPWFTWPASELARDDGKISVSATGDIESATPDDVPLGWRYQGKSAVQTWSTPDRPGVVVRVNGRTEFWASRAPVPGGPAFENFELLSPFEAGQEFAFRITPEHRP
jgi:hypothetical protein